MKIFGIGLSRTGTTTFSEVLKPHYNIKHYPTMPDMYGNKYDGACDIPVIPHYKKLDRTFKNAKFVYTVRDLDEWVNSFVPYIARKKNWNMAIAQIQLRSEIYGSVTPTKKQATNAYKKHEEDVLNYFKDKNNLLILNIVGGDKPKKLWDFLGIDDTPPEEFPVVNKLKR